MLIIQYLWEALYCTAPDLKETVHSKYMAILGFLVVISLRSSVRVLVVGHAVIMTWPYYSAGESREVKRLHHLNYVIA